MNNEVQRDSADLLTNDGKGRPNAAIDTNRKNYFSISMCLIPLICMLI